MIQPIKNIPPFRTVFESSDSKGQFAQFLNTIFYQLNEPKVFKTMENILSDPNKTDKQIYEALVNQIDATQKSFPIWHKLRALSVLLKGMGEQAAFLLKDFRPEAFHDYAEIYSKRYLRTIQKTAKIPLDGTIFSISDYPSSGSLKQRLEAGSIFTYPYNKTHVPLNDPDCTRPEIQPDKTYRSLGDEIPEKSLDLVCALGGLHHTPLNRVSPFIDSLHEKLRPGGFVLLREHDVKTQKVRDIASVVHSFVNASDKAPWEVEESEIREFRTSDEWTKFMEKHGFVRISNEALILPGDPTNNAMMAFARRPETLQDLQIAAQFRKDSFRSPDSTRATWIEWVNVRYAKQFAEFIQSKHAYAFDYLGYLKQHRQCFIAYIKESRKDLPLKKILLSDNFSMNLFILLSTTVECTTGYLSSLPRAGIARLTQGVNWRKATDLTALEKTQAKIEQEYSNFIDHTPFYLFPYLSKIRLLWSAVWHSDESIWTKSQSYIGALLSTIGLLFKAGVSLPIQMAYSQNGQSVEPDRIGILIRDPHNAFVTGPKQINGKEYPIEIVYQTADHYKLALVPRYRIFTEFCKELAIRNNEAQLIEIGSQPTITVDVRYEKGEESLSSKKIESAKLLYEMDILHNERKMGYATYEVGVENLIELIREVGAPNIEYIHE